MPSDSVPLLSKSKFTAGLQCPGRLYRQCYQRELATPPNAAQRARFAAGNRFGELARGLYPDGVLISEPAFHHDRAVEHTRSVIAESTGAAIFEGGFTEDSIRVRADILNKSAIGWELIEVKSSKGAKPEHVPDAAVQLVVLERAGIPIGRVSIAHLNGNYVHTGGDYVPEQVVSVTDVTDRAREFAKAVPARVEAMREILEADEAPLIEIESYCKTPYDCEFIDYCRKREPDWSIEELPRIGDKRRRQLRVSGVRAIPDIPATFRLTAGQERVRQAVTTGKPYVSLDLAAELERIEPPAHFIDFETIAPALPIYAGTKPYEVVPFQWSDHVLTSAGSVGHFEFLADGGGDPRRKFAESLTARLADATTIISYGEYERQRLRGIQRSLPDLAESVQDLLDRPWMNLQKVVSNHYYHPEFHGSYSAKAVLPAVAPDSGYGDLNIQDGELASVKYIESLDPLMPREQRERVRSDLLAYCERDTWAMVLVVAALGKAASADN